MNEDNTPTEQSPEQPARPAQDGQNPNGQAPDAVAAPQVDESAAGAVPATGAVPAADAGAPDAPAQTDAPPIPSATPVPPAPYGQPSPEAGAPVHAGHAMPASFASHMATSVMTAPGERGSSFGAAAEGGTDPLAPVKSADKQKKPFGAGKVAAVIVAAALVGGAAGTGTGYLSSTLWTPTVSSPAEGPGTVTVNNPGSVNETTAIATSVLPSVVTIEVAGAEGSGSGSGVILSDDGYVLTNTHVITLGGASADPAVRVTTSDGRIYDATIVGTDPIYDLAVIKLEDAEDLTPIEFADSSEINVGSTAVAVGAPLGLSNSVTTGIVSALNRSIEIASAAVPETPEQAPEDEDSSQGGPFQFDIPGMENQTATETISVAVIQTDAAINPGNSGGALVDSEGKLIGINVAIATAGNAEESGSIGVGFAIPSNIAERVADEIIENGSATHGLLGASVRDAASVEGAEVAGAYIVETTPGGGAEAAGLEEGDVVTEFNGVPITSASDLTAQVRAAAAGSDATLTYVRDGSSAELEVTLGELSL